MRAGPRECAGLSLVPPPKPVRGVRMAAAVAASSATKTPETVTFAALRRKAIAKYRMPAPVAIGYKQDFE
jgi:hypothetical protein